MNSVLIPEIRFECPDKWEFLFYIRAFVSYEYVGIAKLSREGEKATLHDIIVVDIELPVFRFFTWPKVRHNHRGKGYGSKLLSAVDDNCTRFAIKVLEGEAAGDLSRLLPWYEDQGFEVLPGNVIRKTFNA